MDNQDKQDNLEEIVDRHYKRLHQLNATTIFIKSMLDKHNIKDDLQKIHNKVLQISYGIDNTRKILEQMKKQNTDLKELLSLVESLNKKILRMKGNVPPELIVPVRKDLNVTYKIEQATSTNTNDSEQETIKDCKKPLSNGND